MNAKHIDQLAQWWENAETGTPNPRDLLIVNLGADEYLIEHAGDYWGEGGEYEDTRILARAPKPKPAWHDAVAVMARCSNAPEGHREPFIRSEATRDVWAGEAGHARTEDLRDVTPLIEAKVTDEMVERLESRFNEAARASLPTGLARRMLIVALGLESA